MLVYKKKKIYYQKRKCTHYTVKQNLFINKTKNRKNNSKILRKKIYI